MPEMRTKGAGADKSCRVRCEDGSSQEDDGQDEATWHTVQTLEMGQLSGYSGRRWLVSEHGWANLMGRDIPPRVH